MLAIPALESIRAKLFSAAADSSGTPSMCSCVPEAPSRRPDSPETFRAVRSSFHVVSNWEEVRACPNSYKRANFSRMLRL